MGVHQVSQSSAAKALLLALFGTSLSATTILSVTGPVSGSPGIAPNQTIAISFTIGQSYSNVSISVDLQSTFYGTAYLTTALGPGTTYANQIASSSFVSTTPLNNPGTFQTILRGISIVPGTYFLVLSTTQSGNLVTGTPAWSATSSPVTVADLGASLGGTGYYVSFTFAPCIDTGSGYPPAEPFCNYEFVQNMTPEFVMTGTPIAQVQVHLPPGDLFCSAGANGPGSIYDPAISYCAGGAVVPDGDLFCSGGTNGSGSIYDPSNSSCASGAVLPSGDSFCPAGVYGPGGTYDPSMGTTCYQGVLLPSGDSFCPPGANGSGGLYNPSNGETCNNGISSPLGSLPPAISPTLVSATASGLTYSRASQTFNGSVTITNLGNTAIRGPLQIVFSGLSANVTLLNATSSLSGTPYLTVLVASLASGQSVTVSVQFRNPWNVAIQFMPVIYSGSI
jgi:hypothetical protein